MSLDIDRCADCPPRVVGVSISAPTLPAWLRQFSEVQPTRFARCKLSQDGPGRTLAIRGQRVAPSGNVFERREASRVSAETRVSSRLIRIKSTLASGGLI